MNTNPIYKKESIVTWKSMKLVLLISIFNLALLIYYIARINIEINNIINTMKIDYSLILSIFKQVITIDYFLILLLTPTIAASSISGEREKQNLELMLSTPMTCTDIVIGKLMSCLFNMSIFIFSAIPIFFLVYIYGGVSFVDFSIIFICYFCSIYFVSSIGILCSALCKRTNIAIALCYTSIILIFFMNIICVNGIEKFLNIGLNTDKGIGIFVKYLILFNPSSTFYMALARISSNGEYLANLFSCLDKIAGLSISYVYILISLILQLIFGSIFIFLSIRKIDPRYKL